MARPMPSFWMELDLGCGLWMEKNKQKVMQGETQRDIKIIPTICYAPVVCQVLCWMPTYAIDSF